MDTKAVHRRFGPGSAKRLIGAVALAGAAVTVRGWWLRGAQAQGGRATGMVFALAVVLALKLSALVLVGRVVAAWRDGGPRAPRLDARAEEPPGTGRQQQDRSR